MFGKWWFVFNYKYSVGLVLFFVFFKKLLSAFTWIKCGCTLHLSKVVGISGICCSRFRLSLY